MNPSSSSPPSLNRPPRLAVLISGGGTTLINLHQQIHSSSLSATIPLVIASRPCSGIERSQKMGLETVLLERKQWPDSTTYSENLFALCRNHEIDFVILAGFLTQIVIPRDFELKVLNIHPALIPAFCGKGMFGHYVHEAVIARGCKFSGCTVHFCDNEYDHGPIISQKIVPVMEDDTPDALAARVFEQECIAYPEAIALLAAGRLQVKGNRVRVQSLVK